MFFKENDMTALLEILVITVGNLSLSLLSVSWVVAGSCVPADLFSSCSWIHSIWPRIFYLERDTASKILKNGTGWVEDVGLWTVRAQIFQLAILVTLTTWRQNIWSHRHLLFFWIQTRYHGSFVVRISSRKNTELWHVVIDCIFVCVFVFWRRRLYSD